MIFLLSDRYGNKQHDTGKQVKKFDKGLINSQISVHSPQNLQHLILPTYISSNSGHRFSKLSKCKIIQLYICKTPITWKSIFICCVYLSSVNHELFYVTEVELRISNLKLKVQRSNPKISSS